MDDLNYPSVEEIRRALAAAGQSPRRQLHTVKDVCEEARISPATAWRLISCGILKTVKIGSRTLVTDESLRQLIEAGAPKEAA